MKANRRSAPPLLLAVAMLAALTASCSEQRIIPRPTPTPTPTAMPRVVPPPAPPPPQRPTALDWREAPITPGDWSWGMEGAASVARFAGATLVLRCDRASGMITLARAGEAASAEPMTITTTSAARTLSAAPQSGPAIAVTLAARDPLIDAMVFSRGRFVVDTPGLAPLYVPSWPELSRVAEDCR